MEKEVQNQVRRHIRALMFVCLVAFVLLVWWAAIRLNYKMRVVREGFVDALTIGMWIALGAVILLLVVIALINYYGREKITHEKTGKTDLQDEDI